MKSRVFFVVLISTVFFSLGVIYQEAIAETEYKEAQAALEEAIKQNSDEALIEFIKKYERNYFDLLEKAGSQLGSYKLHLSGTTISWEDMPTVDAGSASNKNGDYPRGINFKAFSSPPRVDESRISRYIIVYDKHFYKNTFFGLPTIYFQEWTKFDGIICKGWAKATPDGLEFRDSAIVIQPW